ncbi:GNAT family N-acetyltransferase [Maribacter sp. HTCC2170]|uniref:GNAT family N-acetyltransferase n=1 Tax=Maribacter sp. (strain HTCC2170 / KCCM 42371) TaxID=313603 RepID=UPI00006BD4CD|nr:GNAT family N-acetyltransferase [Maribacter sp. HTCC2170]EAR02706.1 transcriptional regulator [Maribacter sp. HTCC2170]
MRKQHKLVYKKCGPEDINELTQVSIATFVDAFEKDNDPEDFKNYIDLAFNKTKLNKELKNPNTSFYFVFLEENLVGYFKLNQNEAQSDLKNMDSIELERIYVINEYQGQGLGLQILQEAKKLAKKTNKSYLWLGVWELNKAAIKFYERHGFSKFGMHPYYIGKDRQLDWLMQFDLINFNQE